MLPIVGIILVPGILWGWLFFNFQRYKRFHMSLLLILFLAGMGSGFIALILNHAIEKYTLFWPEAMDKNFIFLGKQIPILSSAFWFLVGMNEEFAKFLILLCFVFPNRHLENPFDGILSAVVVSVGFATMENFYYLDQYGIAVVVIRTFITVPAHAFMSVPMGYFVARSRLKLDLTKKTSIRNFSPTILLFQGWFFSSFLHGLYDFFLSMKMESEAYLQIVLMGGFSFLLSMRAIRSSKKI